MFILIVRSLLWVCVDVSARHAAKRQQITAKDQMLKPVVY
ncbi:hypothetical protein HMPREF1581_00768 [Gardnerella vaginalis JCP8108]|uniref:Uncharacterized protein n=1 Tax=Gardnerella vaginalis JCP8108 TaxID=1261066 RepID=S4GGR1_GARVA|nr:hypothetical protein HMPREF1581_00768 [Gardnerella vaginalis JCP8108]